MKDVFKTPAKPALMAKVILGLSIVGFIVLFLRDPQRGWGNVLINNFYFLSLALSGLVFIAIHTVAQAGWWTGIRRIPEAMTGFLPVALVLMLCVFLGKNFLYPWANESIMATDHHLHAKAAYLNTPFFMIRMGVFFVGRSVFATLIRKSSQAEDAGDATATQKIVKYAAIFLPLFAITFFLASVDWLMSLEPHWFSTIFGIYTFSGLFFHGVAFLTLVVIFLKEMGYLPHINENHLHDLGKLVFAFSTFWAYIWFCQYMLIWYSNIPEETVYYISRTDSEWSWLFVLNLVMNWVVPFFILLPRNAKRNTAVLKRVCILLLVGHWLDIYLMVMPHMSKTRWIGAEEIIVALGYGALFFLVVAKSLEKAPLVPQNAPFLHESEHHHQ